MGKINKLEGGLQLKKGKKPSISIITVVLNGKRHIEETILSVLNQTYKNIEYIVIDGGSTDGTLDIIKKYKDRINYWSSEKDKGIYNAMNKGIKLSSGKIINMLNCGDLYESESIVNDINEIFKKNNNLSFILGLGRFIDDNKKQVNIFRNNPLITTLKFGRFDDCCHQAFFYKKSLHDKFGLYDLSYKLCADRIFIQKIYFSKKYKYRLLNKVLAIRRYNGASRSPKAILESKKLYDEIFGKSFINNFLIIKYYLKRNNFGIKIYKFYEKIKYLVKNTHNKLKNFGKGKENGSGNYNS